MIGMNMNLVLSPFDTVQEYEKRRDIDRQTDRQTDERTDGPMDVQTELASRSTVSEIRDAVSIYVTERISEMRLFSNERKKVVIDGWNSENC